MYPNRRSIRLPYYDYTDEGAYFITICVAQYHCLFGQVGDRGVALNRVGQIALTAWKELPTHFSRIQLDQFVVMPNHVHGILFFSDKLQNLEQTGPQNAASLHPLRTFGPLKAGELGTIVRSYKSAVTRQVNLLRQTPGHVLWQKNYYEHVVRDEPDLNRIRDYILTNPSRWVADKYYQS
ncbi:MAG: transposase [Anaerolineae bacterium]|nr:transposase [Anaerolineae bacterium]